MTTTSSGTTATTGCLKLFLATPFQHIRGGGESANGTACWLYLTHTSEPETQLTCYFISLLLILLHELAIFRWEAKKTPNTADSPRKGK